MNLLDVLLLLILFAFVYKGSKQGIAYMVGQAIGVMIGVLVASRLFDDFARLIQPLFLGNYDIAALFSFVLLFQIINEFLGFLLKSTGLFDFLKHLPLIDRFDTIDMWTGALLGLFVGNLILGIVLYFLTRNSLTPWFDQLLQTSTLTPLFINFASWFIVFFPPEFKQLPSIITKI